MATSYVPYFHSLFNWSDAVWDKESGDGYHFDGLFNTKGLRTGIYETKPELKQISRDFIAELTGISNATMTSGYAFDYDGVYYNGTSDSHGGIDYGVSSGTPVRAVVPGTIISTVSYKDGWFVAVQGDDGNRWIYGHLAYAPNKRRIEEGDVIGQVKNLGRRSHLHMEVHTPPFNIGDRSLGGFLPDTPRTKVLSETISPLQAYWQYKNRAIIGDSSNNWLVDLDWNNIIDGGGGIDTVDYLGRGSNVWLDLSTNHASSNHRLDFIYNVENARGTDFNDRIIGNNQDNQLLGWGGNDHISGGAGNDLLDGGAGNDLIEGGSGNDWIVDTDGRDKIYGNSGHDTIDYSYKPSNVWIDLSTYHASSNDELDLIYGVENAWGTEFDDMIIGDAGFNTLSGQGGRDVINGGAGNDTLLGGYGHDRLQGSDGLSGVEFDILSGGFGNDTFILGNHTGIFYRGNGHAHITDFEIGVDTIELGANFAYPAYRKERYDYNTERHYYYGDLVAVVDFI